MIKLVSNKAGNDFTIQTPSASPPRNSSSAQDLNWKDRAINVLNETDNRLNGWMPNWILQTKIDELGRYIEDKFSCFGEINQWLRSNGQGAWYLQLATYLVKLPLRAAQNIIHLLYGIVKGIFQAVVHPLESLTHVAKMIVSLLYALTVPETYCKIGAGMIGAGFGQALILDIPISIITMVIGGTLVIGGLSFGALKQAIVAEQGKKNSAIFDFFGKQLEQIPESLLTGFYMGLLIGGIRKAMATQQQKAGGIRTPKEAKTYTLKEAKAHTPGEAEAYAAEFIKKYHLPSPRFVHLDSSGNVILKFDLHTIDQFHIPPESGSIISDLKIVLTPDGGGHAIVDWYDPWVGDDNHSWSQYPLEELGIRP